MISKVVFALVLIAWIGEHPLELDTATYGGRWRSVFVVFAPLLAPLPVISLSPWQLLLVAFAPFCVGASVARLHAHEMDKAIYVGLACTAVTVSWGLVTGGSAYYVYYQVWRYLAALLLAYMMMSAIRTERDLVLLGKIVILAALIRATLCIYHYWMHLRGKFDPLPEYVISHDDSMIFVLAVQIVWIWVMIKGGKLAVTRALVVSGVVLYAMILNDRRLAWIAMVLPLPLLYLLIGAGSLRRTINRYAMVITPLAIAYVAAGMSSDHPMFAPVHALTTAGSYEDASSLTREEEIRNLLRTLVDFGNPLFGTGWGHPYAKVESFYSNYDPNWTLVLYTPHNAIVGLAAFSGFVGFFGMLGIVPVAAYLAARGYRSASGSSVLQAASMAAICGLSIYLVQCYADVGFQSFQGAVLLAASLATAGRAAVLGQSSPAPRVVDDSRTASPVAAGMKLTRPRQTIRQGAKRRLRPRRN